MQIVRKHRGNLSVLKHRGSVHTRAELTALFAVGEEKLADYGGAGQLEIELGLPTDVASPPRARTAVGSRSSIRIDVITQLWTRLGFDDTTTDASVLPPGVGTTFTRENPVQSAELRYHRQ